MKASVDWQIATAMPKGKPRSDERKARNEAFLAARKNSASEPNLSRNSPKPAATPAGSAIIWAATIPRPSACAPSVPPINTPSASAANPALKERAASTLNSIEGKSNDAVVRFRMSLYPSAHYRGLTLLLILDPYDKRGWQAIALKALTKYVRIVRRTIKGGRRWFCQLIQEGQAPNKTARRRHRRPRYRAVDNRSRIR